MFTWLLSCITDTTTRGEFWKELKAEDLCTNSRGLQWREWGKNGTRSDYRRLARIKNWIKWRLLISKQFHADHPEKVLAVFKSFHRFSDAGKFLDVWLAVSSQFCVFKSQTVWNHVRMRLHVDSISPEWRKMRIRRKDKDKRE